MEILDQDMQMVRDFLSQWGAPEYIKGHFENLVETQAADAERVEELKEKVEKLEAEAADCDEWKERVNELEDELAQRNADQDSALETVKYWLHDVLVLKRPMQTPPRAILRIVEDVL